MILSLFISNLEKELEKRDLSENTVQHYIKTVLNIHKKIYGNENVKNLKFLNDIDEVEKAIADYSDNTRKNIYAVLSSLLFEYRVKRNFKDTYEYYKAKADELTKDVAHLKSSNKKSTAQEENWMDWEDILKIRDEYDDYAEHIKDKKNISDKDFEILIASVALGLYTHLPPRRNEYSILKLVKSADDIQDDEKGNFYVKDEEKLFLNKYKTAKKYGEAVVDLPEKLIKTINVYLKYHPKYQQVKKQKSYTIPFLIDINGKPFDSVNAMTRILNKVFKPKKIAATMLRHIYLTGKYGEELEEMEGDAAAMGHSLSMQKEYIKN